MQTRQVPSTPWVGKSGFVALAAAAAMVALIVFSFQYFGSVARITTANPAPSSDLGPSLNADPGLNPSPPPEEEPTQANPAENEILVPYKGPINHIFFHPLIAYPERAFDNDNMSKGYNDWMITVPEFNRILNALYQRDYILIDISSVYEEKVENGQSVLVKQELLLPEGKKPVILSIDDLNYYDYMRQNGNVNKLALDSQRNVVTISINAEGQEDISNDNEIIPLLDSFVRAHPDFSFHGAKGVIALTGFQGILGYRTNDIKAPDYELELDGARQVARRLLETGWSFASHGYGHLKTPTISYNSLVHDTQKWKQEVEPLTGPTSVYIYPFGSKVLPGDPKFTHLLSEGFRVLLSVGPRPYERATSDYVMADRRRIDGLAFRSQSSMLLDLFDSREVIDSVRPQ